MSGGLKLAVEPAMLPNLSPSVGPVAWASTGARQIVLPN